MTAARNLDERPALDRIADALNELLAIERERLDSERERAAKRSPRRREPPTEISDLVAARAKRAIAAARGR